MGRHDSSRIYENSQDLAAMKEKLKRLSVDVSDKMDTASSTQTRRHNQNMERLVFMQVDVDDINKKLDLIMEHLGIEVTV